MIMTFQCVICFRVHICSCAGHDVHALSRDKVSNPLYLFHRYMTSCVGNLFYLAPEVFSGDHYTESAGTGSSHTLPITHYTQHIIKI